MSNMPPASPSTIEGAAAYIAAIEKAFNSGDLQKVSTLIEHDFVTAWFGLLPSRFIEIVNAIRREGGDVSPFIQFVAAFLTSPFPTTDGNPELEDLAISVEGRGYPYDSFLSYARTLGLRVQGRSVEALEIADELVAVNRVASLFDSTMGWTLFTTVQHGVTAMLAGDFAAALTSFTSARMHATIPSLGFFVRDACVKSAMIEALYGDPERARGLLRELDHTPRTASWVEDGTDALRTLIEAALEISDSYAALEKIDDIPLNAVGEMWPFYIACLQRVMMRHGDNPEGNARYQHYEGLPFPQVERQGVTASVLPLWGAYISIVHGNLDTARERLETADPNFPPVKLALALIELLHGRPREALDIASELRPGIGGLRSLELQRLGLVAAAQLQLGSVDGCRSAIKSVLSISGGLRSYEVVWFPEPVRELAEKEFKEWPKSTSTTSPAPGFRMFPAYQNRLTDRELEILRDLAKGLTREEIAKADFVSINTVKGHLRGLYRKLGVTSRNAAVIEGERRGLL